MSYCRWSEDCDVYVYETAEGYAVTCVDHFHFDTPGECADKLVQLRDEGNKVPQDVIDELRQEQQGYDDE